MQTSCYGSKFNKECKKVAQWATQIPGAICFGGHGTAPSDTCQALHGRRSIQIPRGAWAPHSPPWGCQDSSLQLAAELPAPLKPCSCSRGRRPALLRGGEHRCRQELFPLLHFGALSPLVPTVRLPKVEKNSSISFCSSWFLFSASSRARSEFLSFISSIVYFFFSWSSSSSSRDIRFLRLALLSSSL